MKQTKDIAIILKERDSQKYKDIIVRAENNGYHDFKFDTVIGHPEYGDCLCPKVQLVNDLSKFPELVDIQKDVINGKYDESPDGQDKERIRSEFIEDGSTDSLFTMFGLKPPSEAERMLNKPINN